MERLQCYSKKCHLFSGQRDPLCRLSAQFHTEVTCPSMFPIGCSGHWWGPGIQLGFSLPNRTPRLLRHPLGFHTLVEPRGAPPTTVHRSEPDRVRVILLLQTRGQQISPVKGHLVNTIQRSVTEKALWTLTF